jgi:hypothetical protein
MSDSVSLPAEGSKPWDFRDEPYAAEIAAPAGYRPGGLTAVCIIAIVLGCLGMLTGAASLVTNLAANQVQQFQAAWGAAGATNEAVKVQSEMNAKTAAIMNRFRLVNVLLSLSQLVLCGVLIAGGSRALRLDERGRKLLWVACGLAILFELTRAVPTVLMQLENMALMEDYFPRLMKASIPKSQADQVGAFAEMMARFSLIMGWVVLLGWMFLKLAFFGSAFHYLSRPKTRSLYRSKPAKAPKAA